MPTECIQEAFRFHSQSGRELVARFDGGTITSDGGGVLLGAVERRTEIVRQFAGCFVDHRDPEAIEHPVYDLVAQRVYGLALGYEDLNDHDELRSDPSASPYTRCATRSYTGWRSGCTGWRWGTRT